MSLDWIVNPVAIYGMLAAALAACAAPFLVMRAEIRAVRRRAEESESAAKLRLEETELAMERLRKSVADAGELPAAPPPGLNLTRRAQAVRMYQRGEGVATIAAALRAPRNEIELLIRLQEMQQYRAS